MDDGSIVNSPTEVQSGLRLPSAGRATKGTAEMSVAATQSQRFDDKENAREYYGRTLEGTDDLRTSACCVADAVSPQVRRVLSMLHTGITDRFYGCGSPIPRALRGLRILDVGCGTGRDAYVMSGLAGPTGFVTGIDMTDAQIAGARRYVRHQTEVFGYATPNVQFVQGDIEELSSHFDEASMDVVTSNCVLNLVADKPGVLKAVHRLLKPGGEFHFADIYADRRVGEALRCDPVLHGECLGGALYVNDFLRMARSAGFPDPRRIAVRDVAIDDDEIAERIGNVRFRSATYSLWKIDGLEDRCEDYCHVAVYRGGMPDCAHRLALDEGHAFEQGRPERVCGNTALMLSETRFAPYFDVIGSFAQHFGDFEGCGTPSASDRASQTSEACC